MTANIPEIPINTRWIMSRATLVQTHPGAQLEAKAKPPACLLQERSISSVLEIAPDHRETSESRCSTRIGLERLQHGLDQALRAAIQAMPECAGSVT